MTRKTKRNIERWIEEFESMISPADVTPIELSETDKEHIDTVVSDALEAVTDEERARLDELADEIEADGGSDRDDSSAAVGEYCDLLSGAGAMTPSWASSSGFESTAVNGESNERRQS